MPSRYQVMWPIALSLFDDKWKSSSESVTLAIFTKALSLSSENLKHFTACCNVVRQAVMLTPITVVPPEFVVLRQRPHVLSDEDQSHWSRQSKMKEWRSWTVDIPSCYDAGKECMLLCLSSSSSLDRASCQIWSCVSWRRRVI